MHWAGGIVVLFALVKGDYVTPKSGPYAGQLGPWSNVVSASNPRATGS